jgi:hypothetical protein
MYVHADTPGVLASASVSERRTKEEVEDGED